jgi:hypothetical protein
MSCSCQESYWDDRRIGWTESIAYIVRDVYYNRTLEDGGNSIYMGVDGSPLEVISAEYERV